jgi:hypothetical protein
VFSKTKIKKNKLRGFAASMTLTVAAKSSQRRLDQPYLNIGGQS